MRFFKQQVNKAEGDSIWYIFSTLTINKFVIVVSINFLFSFTEILPER